MGALEDLKVLIMEGMLEKEVEVKLKDKVFKFKIRTMTLLEDLKAMQDAGLTDVPKNGVENFNYILAAIPYIVKEVNGEPVKPETLKEFIGVFPGDVVMQIFDAYNQLRSREIKAGEELKNS